MKLDLRDHTGLPFSEVLED